MTDTNTPDGPSSDDSEHLPHPDPGGDAQQRDPQNADPQNANDQNANDAEVSGPTNDGDLMEAGGTDSEIASAPAWMDVQIREISAAYFAAVQEGERPDRAQWEQRHPELVPYLGKRLQFLEQVALGVLNTPEHEVSSDDSATRQGEGDTSNLGGSGPGDSARATLSPEPPESRRFVKCPNCEKINLVSSPDAVRTVCDRCGDEFVVAGSLQPSLSGEYRKRIGRFLIVSILGRGTFGTVYHAYDRDFQQSRAIKVPRRDLFTLPEVEERVLAEARAAARLRHLNFVQVLEIGRDEAWPFLVMEFIEGTTLEVELWRRKRIPQSEAVERMIEIAIAMNYAHDRGVIHRDLKPANILIDRENRPVLIDYGLARHGNIEITVNEDGDIIGSPAYMSPEQASGDLKSVCPASDVYSLAVILFRLLTGTLPFLGSRDETIRKVIHDAPPMPTLIEPSISAELESVILKALAKSPDARYATAAEFAEALRPFVTD